MPILGHNIDFMAIYTHYLWHKDTHTENEHYKSIWCTSSRSLASSVERFQYLYGSVATRMCCITIAFVRQSLNVMYGYMVLQWSVYMIANKRTSHSSNQSSRTCVYMLIWSLGSSAVYIMLEVVLSAYLHIYHSWVILSMCVHVARLCI